MQAKIGAMAIGVVEDGRKNARNSCFAGWGTNGAWMGWEGGKAKWQIAGCPRMNGIWAHDGGRGGPCLADLLSVWGVGRKDNSRPAWTAPVTAEGHSTPACGSPNPLALPPLELALSGCCLLQVPSSLCFCPVLTVPSSTQTFSIRR